MQQSCKNDDPALRLRSARLRSTRARRAVLAALMRAKQPLTHAQLAETGGLKALDRVTLYRTLSALEAARLIHVVRAADGTAVFCANPRGTGCPGGHAHFQCLACRRTLCLLEQVLPRVEAGPGYRIQGKQFVVFGWCPACARRTKRAGRKSRNPRPPQMRSRPS